MTRRAPCSAPAAGARPSPSVLADAGARGRDVGSPRRGGRPDQRRARQPRLPARPRLPAAVSRHDRPGRGASRAPTSSCSPCRRRRCAPTSPRGADAPAADAVIVSLMKGVELGTTKRMSEVIAEVGGRRARADRVVSGPNLAREIAATQPAASVVACADPADGRAGRGGVRDAVLPALHRHRRRRHRARRRREERHRPGRRHGRGPGLGRQHQGLDHHPRARRDRPARRWRSAPTRRPSPGWPASATSSPPACRRCRATTRSACTSAGACRLQEVVAVTRQTAEGVKSCASILELARSHGVDVPIVEHVDAVVQHGRTAPKVVETPACRAPARPRRPERPA